ncbi:MAG: hypothetical protein AMJ90_09895 [candidate division Zixibacteria bacterium SM23_73_2]|nr:MAG: hypothetical protein AMJ90_09895 [candidate division Zixibacteria bacterium SM23_73_2]
MLLKLEIIRTYFVYFLLWLTFFFQFFGNFGDVVTYVAFFFHPMPSFSIAIMMLEVATPR